MPHTKSRNGTVEKSRHSNDGGFRIKLAKELRKDAYDAYVGRGVDPQKAAQLADTVEWSFSKKRDDVF